MPIYKPSLAFFRITFLIFGFLMGGWLVSTFTAWFSATGNTGDAGIMLIPIATLLFGIVYITALFLTIFKSVITKDALFRRMAIFFSVGLVTSIVFLTFSGKLFWIPIFRITNAPLTVFDRSTLERKLGFKPLLPTQPFSELEPGWTSISQGNFELNFKQGGGNLGISQITDTSTSSVMRWCREMQQDTENFVSTPVVIAGQKTLLYSPKTIKHDVYSMYCVSLNDRVIFVSPGYGRSVGSIESLKFWLENLE